MEGKMSPKQPERRIFGTLELILMAAVVAMVFQLFPGLSRGLIWLADVRNWSRTAGLWVNVFVLVALFAARFGPRLVGDWRERRLRRHAEQETANAQRKLKEQRQTLQRIKDARKRRLY
jgi:hypothetical protein